MKILAILLFAISVVASGQAPGLRSSGPPAPRKNALAQRGAPPVKKTSLKKKAGKGKGKGKGKAKKSKKHSK